MLLDLQNQWNEAEFRLRNVAGRWFQLIADVSDQEYGGYQDQIYPGDFISMAKERAWSANSPDEFELNFRRHMTPAFSHLLSSVVAEMSVRTTPRDLFSNITHEFEAEIEAYRQKKKWSASAWRTSWHGRRFQPDELHVAANAFDPLELRLEALLYGLYVAWRPSSRIIIPDSRRVVLNALIHDRALVRTISPRQFEELIAYLYETLGCRVELTQATRDFGADILVWHQAPIGAELLTVVQTKRYLPPKKVGLPEVLPLPGSMLHYGADSGQVVASSTFTTPAVQYAKNHRLGLVDAEALQNAIASIFGK
jgi:hypothetical protein